MTSETPIGCPYCAGHYCTENLRSELAAKEAELVRERAKVARCDIAARTVVYDTILDKQDAEYYRRIIVVHRGWLRDFLASLDAQSERDARVLMAADNLVSTWNDENLPGDTWTANISTAENELRQAVRGDKNATS